MRLIDADEIERILNNAIQIQEGMSKEMGIEKDDFVQGELKAYKDILNGIKEQPTIPYDMKWNPECEDCRPKDIYQCQLCRQR